MSFQQRTLIALALCALIFVLFDWLMPKPEAPPETENAVATETSEGKETKSDAKSVKPTVEEEDEEPAPSGDHVASEERELRNELVAVRVINRSPAKGGIVSGIQLLSPQFEKELTGTDALRLGGSPTLEISFADEESDVKLPKSTTFELRDEGPRHVTLGHRDGEVDVTERFELGEGYEAKLVVTVTNRSKVAKAHRIHIGTRVGVVDSRYDIARGLCRTGEDLEYEDASDVEDGPIHYTGPITWGGVDNKYFGFFVIATQPATDCEIRLAEGGGFVQNRISGAVTSLEPGASQTYEYGLYLGAKELERLQAYSAVQVKGLDIDQAIDWGFFGGVSEWLGRMLLGMLRWFFAVTHSWGISIVLLTVVVKLITLPLTLKQMSSMKRMRAINPEMQKIRAKYADDRVKQGQEMQALFARSGVNPLAGCLPTLVQLPIWFALYSMLSAAVELVHQKFLWLPDLTQQDPIYVLPLALGGLMIVQNRMMPNTMDEAQAKMMRWLMPIMFTLFMLFLPSGLAVYIFANILLSIVQTAIQVGVGGKEQPAAGKPA